MADFRQIHCRIWQDNWFSELEDDEKLFFIYLFSNHRASIAGIYEIPFRYLVFETGMGADRIQEILSKFAKQKKVYYDYDSAVLWIVNLRKYNETRSIKVKVRIDKDVEMIPDSKVKELYCKYHNIPYKYPISETDTDTETETETETPEDEKLPPDKPEREQWYNALLKTYNTETGLYPKMTEESTAAVYRMVDAKITCTDLKNAIEYKKERHKPAGKIEWLESSARVSQSKRIAQEDIRGKPKRSEFAMTHYGMNEYEKLLKEVQHE